MKLALRARDWARARALSARAFVRSGSTVFARARPSIADIFRILDSSKDIDKTLHSFWRITRGVCGWPFCNLFLERQVYWYTSRHIVIQMCNIYLRVASYREIRVVLRILRSAKKIRPDLSVKRGNKYYFGSPTDDQVSLWGLCIVLTWQRFVCCLPFHRTWESLLFWQYNGRTSRATQKANKDQSTHAQWCRQCRETKTTATTTSVTQLVPHPRSAWVMVMLSLASLGQDRTVLTRPGYSCSRMKYRRTFFLFGESVVAAIPGARLTVSRQQALIDAGQRSRGPTLHAVLRSRLICNGLQLPTLRCRTRIKSFRHHCAPRTVEQSTTMTLDGTAASPKYV